MYKELVESQKADYTEEITEGLKYLRKNIKRGLPQASFFNAKQQILHSLLIFCEF